MSQEKWSIGIDFGTSNTCVVAYNNENGELYTHSLAEVMGDKSLLNIPTRIAVDKLLKTEEEKRKGEIDEEPYYVGAESDLHPLLRSFNSLKNAARQLTPDNGRFGRDLKPCEYPFEQCGIDTDLQFGNNDYSLTISVRKLLVQFFRKVLHIGDDKYDINQRSVKRIVIGQPVVEGRKEGDGSRIKYEETLKELLAESFTGKRNDASFIEKVTVVAEPELAGITYLYTANERTNKKVLVIDIGGGTTDFSILEYKNGKPEANNIGACEIAGNAIDEIIFNLLPTDVPQSKRICTGCKERLFAERNEDIITPKETEKLTSCNINNSKYIISYKEKESKNYIALSTGKLYKGGKPVKEGKAITAVFTDIGKALKKALDNSKISGINTVFFVGGTSIITPLRETLINIITASGSSYCASGFDPVKDVVTMFGDNARTIKADWGDPLAVTCYNAVAIGACIKAMGEKNLRIKPKLEAKICGDYQGEWESTSNNLLMGTSGGVPFARLICKNSDIADWLEVYGQLKVELRIDDGKNTTFIISKEQCSRVKDISIVAILRNDSIEFKVYMAGDSVPLQNVMQQTEIQIIQN